HIIPMPRITNEGNLSWYPMPPKVEAAVLLIPFVALPAKFEEPEFQGLSLKFPAYVSLGIIGDEPQTITNSIFPVLVFQNRCSNPNHTRFCYGLLSRHTKCSPDTGDCDRCKSNSTAGCFHVCRF